MILATVLVVLVSPGLLSPSQAARSTGETAKVELIRQHIDMLEASARQAKGKTDGDAQALSALEKKYGDTLTAFDNWRTAASSATEKDWSKSRKQIESLAATVARGFAEFGQDAQAFTTGTRRAVASDVVARFEARLIDAARVLARSEEQTRLRLASTLSCRPWSEIR